MRATIDRGRLLRSQVALLLHQRGDILEGLMEVLGTLHDDLEQHVS
jgi:hypothetical protein